MALGDWLPQGLSRSEMMTFINANIRSISRVVVLPQWRGASLATFLVRHTIDKIGVGLIETVAAMGQFNSFFEKAGMEMFVPPVSDRQKRTMRTLSICGLKDGVLLDVDAALEHISSLDGEKQDMLWKEVGVFIGAYGKKRLISDKRQKLALTLSRLSGRGVYFYHLKPN